jgi:hypothetical protein
MRLHEKLLLITQISILGLLSLYLLSGSHQVYSDKPEDLARRYTRSLDFDFFNWTLDAISIKLAQSSIKLPYYLNEADRRQVVTDYLDLIEAILQAENQLNLLYTDPSIPDPVAASSALRVELSNFYDLQKDLAPLAEGILEAQISTLLDDLGLAVGGQPLPPVLFHVSPLPYHLIISPRDRIQQDAAISLVPDITVDRQDSLEDDVSAAMDVSALVVPVGGIGTYPTMVMRTTSLDWLADTIAHEWIHNWLGFQPLGFNYNTSPELRTMNETTASIAGSEMAFLIMQRFYPPMAEVPGVQIVSHVSQPFPPDWLKKNFDFRLEMHTTRIHVDELLAQGKVDAAEEYMEARRQVFWDHGYIIRKLNQAYFAFYGAYADVPGGPAGEDPVGPAVRLLRELSPSLTEFLHRMAAMDSFEDLQLAVTP